MAYYLLIKHENENIRELKMQETSGYKKTLNSRHLLMISLGGVIGTGLFLSSGYTINQAGPLGSVIAYLIGGMIAFCVMQSLGELSVNEPDTGAFSHYATKYINAPTGYTVAWLYWLTWTVAIGSEFVAAGILMSEWFPSIPVWIWSTFFGMLVLFINTTTVKLFGEIEFWFSIVKVIAIIAFIGLGVLYLTGFIGKVSPVHHAGFSNFYAEGWFPTGFAPIVGTLAAVIFAFSGTELIGVASGETNKPEEAIPKAIKANLWRLLIFFIGSIVVIASILPRAEAGVTESPFVAVLKIIGIPYASDIMNVVIISALLSTANSGLYGAARMMATLSNQGTLPKFVGKLSKKGIPVNATFLSMLGGMFALLSSYYAASTVYLTLVSVSGFAVIVVWLSISLSHLGFRKNLAARGISPSSLKYSIKSYPVAPIISVIACIFSIVCMIVDTSQRVALVISLVSIALCYGSYYLIQFVQNRKLAKEKIS